MGAKLNKGKSVSFEESMTELENILAELEYSKMPIDLLIEKYARAKECLNQCKIKLEDAELKIGKLSESGIENFDAES